jgi:hypothetical protein
VGTTLQCFQRALPNINSPNGIAFGHLRIL